MVEPLAIGQQLLQHVGAMCLHQLNNDMMSTSMSSYILQNNINIIHLERVIDIVDYAVSANDERTLTVGLLMLQVRNILTVVPALVVVVVVVVVIY